MNTKEWPHANPCSKCGREPDKFEIFGLYYVQCRNCDKIELSISPKLVVQNWNELYGRTTVHRSKKTPTGNGGCGKSKTGKTK